MLLLLGLVPAAGRAQPASSPGDGADGAKVELAKRHYALGEVYYNQGDYAKALAAFRESHGLSGKPALLYNIGRCQEALGELEAAIASYQRYLDEAKVKDPDLQQRLQNLKARLAAKKPPADVTPPARPSEGPPPRRWMRPTAWALVAAGAAVLGTGIALGVVARSRAKEVEQAYAAGAAADPKAIREWADLQSTEKSGRSMQTGMIVSVIVGAVAAVGGITLHILAPRAERKIALHPLLDNRLVGLVAGLRF